MIASLGGAALMVGISQRSKSTNLLAGVAIATALMPPLCTAGFYLYLVNSVFIGRVTYLFSKALHLRPPVEGELEGVDSGTIRKRHVVLTVVVVFVFVTPSLFVAYDVVRESGWRARLAKFQQENLVFGETQVEGAKVTGRGERRVLEWALVGSPLSEDLKSHLTQQLRLYNLGDLELRFVQPRSLPLIGPAVSLPTTESLFPSLAHLAWGELASQGNLDSKLWKDLVAFARWSVEPTDADKARLEAFLRLRFDRANLSLVHETLVPATNPEENR